MSFFSSVNGRLRYRKLPSTLTSVFLMASLIASVNFGIMTTITATGQESNLAYAQEQAPTFLKEITFRVADVDPTLVSTLNVAVGPQGHIYWGNQENGVYVVNFDGQLLARKLTTLNPLTIPMDIAVDSQGNVYVAYYSSAPFIQKFTSTLVPLTSWGSKGTGDGQFNQPEGIAVDKDGFVYVLDVTIISSNEPTISRIQKFSGDGGYVTQWVGPRDATDLEIDSTGNLYVGSRSDRTIYIYNRDGQPQSSFGYQAPRYAGLENFGVDGAGNVYFTEPISLGSTSFVVKKFNTQGELLVSFPTGTFISIDRADLAVDTAGKIYLGTYDFNQGQGIVRIFEQAPGDLIVKEVKPVQAPENPTVLVEGKPTVLQVTIDNTFAEPKLADIHIVAQSFDLTLNNVEIAPGVKTYYLPNEIPNFVYTGGNILPVDTDIFDATVEIDPESKISEVDETNNIASIASPLEVKKTRTFQVLYVPISRSGGNVDPPTCDDVKRMALRSGQFITGAFPIRPDESIHVADCSFPPIEVEDELTQTTYGYFAKTLMELSKRAWCPAVDTTCTDLIDRVVGVVPDGVIRLGGVDGDPKKGYADPTYPHASVLVDRRAIDGETTAHEIGHTFGLEHKHVSTSAPGYWYREVGVPLKFDASTHNFMEWVGQGDIVDRWISTSTFDYLLQKLKENPEDPPVIGISGLIFKDNRAIFYNLEKFNDIVDIPLDNSGDYQAIYLDNAGNVIGQTGFSSLFTTWDHFTEEVDVVPFALRIPYIEGTEKIELRKGEQVLATSSFESGGGIGSDTTPPIITVPENMTVEATSDNGAEVSYGEVTAQDDVDGLLAADCSPASGSTFPIGETIVECIATDAAGNTATETFSITVVPPADTTAPDTTINSAKDSEGTAIQNETSTTSDTIVFEFSSPDADVSKFQCSIDGSQWEDNCTSPKSYSGLSEGAHLFSVVALDAAGNTDQTPDTFEWTISEPIQQETSIVIEGFYPPIDPPPTFNTINSGRTLPFKFNVYEVSSSDGTTRTEITDTSIVQSFEVVRDVSRTECNNAVVDAAEETTTSSTSLVYDTQEGQFIQQWKFTPRTSYSPNSCWTATLTVSNDDGSVTATKEALIKIR